MVLDHVNKNMQLLVANINDEIRRAEGVRGLQLGSNMSAEVDPAGSKRFDAGPQCKKKLHCMSNPAAVETSSEGGRVDALIGQATVDCGFEHPSEVPSSEHFSKEKGRFLTRRRASSWAFSQKGLQQKSMDPTYTDASNFRFIHLKLWPL